MEKHGVFISHRHTDWMLAGRIYDYLKAEGLHPFLDADTLGQGDFPEALTRQICTAPYFLLVLTKNTFHDLSENSWICREIATALHHQREILLVADEQFSWPETLPQEIDSIRNHHYYVFNRETFLQIMERICRKDIRQSKLTGVIDWRTRAQSLSRTYVTSRETIEAEIATLANRFGEEFIQCVREHREYTGENRIKFIHMSCYAASIIFCPSADMVDERAFDLGMMFNVFAYLLKHDDFSLEIVINAPGSYAAQDAVDNEKLGNSSMEANAEAIFLASYYNIHRLIQEDPVFRKAYQNKRFRIMVTDNVMPYSLFQVEYQKGYEENNHIKVDLYSEGLLSNMDRRCMLFFKEEDPDNYNFFVQRYEYLRNVKKSRRLIKENHEQWIQAWEEFQEEMN